MATSTPQNNGLRAVPPRPQQPPQVPRSDRQINNKLNVKFSPDGIIPPLALHLSKTTVVNAADTQKTPAALPGSNFNSNEDIRAFANAIRQQARDRAGLRAMDAEALDTILRMIPDTTGSMAGARMRARRVSRWLKKIAAAEKLIAKSSVALYASFQREYESELSKVGKGRAQPTPRAPFTWN